ncbi:hypothetical protein T05_7364 [Trichinella murrelli]|uniref:Secreted protein n=1 Tax=Trichinella murrelli TaxID=144512 RepID=A0A0V0T7I5_9BILA|nr:hypothetical protein T05_7364 [Trichinella murrelli]
MRPFAPRVLHFLKLLAAWFVCGSDDGGGSLRQAKMLTWSIRILWAASSTVPCSQTSKTQSMFPDTLPLFRTREFDESRVILNGMDSAAERAVSN